MNPIPSVLFVSHCFPPDAQVGSQRMARFCKYLPEFGFRPIVLTVEERLYETLDRDFPWDREIRVERTHAMATPLDLYRRWRSPSKSGNGEAAVRSEPGFLKRHGFALLATPDRYWGWYFAAVRAGERLLREEPIVAMVSSGPPWISHLVARRLKRGRPDVRWLADFRDPWARSLFTEKLPGWRNAIDRRLEASSVAAADLVICNTDRLLELFRASYPALPAEHFFTLTNGFDDAPDLDAMASPLGGERVALHLGEIYGGRRIDTFCKAVAQLWESGRLDSSWRVRFLGDIDPAAAEAAVRGLPEAARLRIQFEPRVSWTHAQEALRAADVLLIFQGGLGLQVPAKFYEYLQTGKPIFTVAERGATTDAVDATGVGAWVEPHDSARIAEAFLRVLEPPAEDQAEARLHSRSRYHYRVLTASLAQCVRAPAAASHGTPAGRTGHREWAACVGLVAGLFAR